MRAHATLNAYLAKMYTVNFLLLLLGFLGLIYMFDTVELMRRASGYSDVPLSLVFQMALLKLPEVGQMLLPFAILFSAMFTFWQLTRRHELIVVRSSGVSVWQFLMPVLCVAVFAGFFHMTVLNPVGSVLVSKYEQLENVYLKRQENQIAIFKEGFWLRQKTIENGGYVILHASKIDQESWNLKEVTVLYFDEADGYLQRLDAQDATLETDRWLFNGVRLHRPGSGVSVRDAAILHTNLTANDIEESFASPETMSFWQLPGFIKTVEQTGFDATRLRVHYQSLWSQPLMFAAMVLLAASVSMRPPRLRGAFMLIAIGVFLGFVVFFMSSFLQALGSSQQIPVILAAWSPALISFLLGLTIMINLEDG